VLPGCLANPVFFNINKTARVVFVLRLVLFAQTRHAGCMLQRSEDVKEPFNKTVELKY
jgi:hypothetical protein